MSFVRGEGGDNPEPVRPLSLESAAAAKDKITAFLDTLENYSTSDYPCLEAYRAFEQERIAAFDMILEADNPDRIGVLNDQLYGAFTGAAGPEAVAHLAAHIKSLQPTTAAQPYHQLVCDALQGIGSSASLHHHFTALNDYRLKLRPFMQRRFGFVEELLDDYKDVDFLTSEQLRDVLQITLERTLGAGRNGWNAVVSAGAPNVFINNQHREVTIPAHRQYTKSHADTLAVHEIGVHVQRSVNGSLSRERLAGFGLAGYGPIEEAFGVLLGNAAKQTYHQINSLIPFAVINFAASEPRPTFRQVHEFARALIITLANPDAATLDGRYLEYGRAAFSRTIRVLRLGHSGLIERSTTKYWNGQLLLERHFDEHGLSDRTFDEFFAGKYDCLNPSQLPLITEHSATIRKPLGD